MKRVTLETVVGLFMLIGFLCLAYLSIQLGRVELTRRDNCIVYAQFDSVSGLKSGASVEIAGVEVGRVDRILLDTKSGAQATVYLRLRPGVKVSEDVIASVRTRGIIGDKFILLKPGGSDKILANGARIRETESALDLEEIVGKFIHGKVE
jgi:phospholipid/cholesterol/gamma-HCH transport system substrate-binding protein